MFFAMFCELEKKYPQIQYITGVGFVGFLFLIMRVLAWLVLPRITPGPSSNKSTKR